MPDYSGEIASGIPEELRLDRYVAEYLGLLNRSQIKSRAMRGMVNGKEVKLSRIVRPGDRVELSWNEAEPAELIPEDIPLDIIYEDSRVAVINKAQGMVVHPGAGNRRGTLANALLFRRLRLGKEGGGLRPGIVHRLDKDTSGVIISAYDDEALEFLAQQFRERSALKTYLAIVAGVPKERSGRIETKLARDPGDRIRFAVSPSKGKHALTFYRLIRSWDGYSLILLRPKTGRTHQLRVHMRFLGHPIIGDKLYGTQDRHFPGAELMLHAARLTIKIPGSEEAQSFRAPVPPRFSGMISALKKDRS
ncbi:RluA family pseudouridine synthase [Treponema sp. OttesenSCG-928-L16]|nr:RluA family pseudouridine synthase [Treponema sp. OttesenSCG-928-L16]